MSKEIRRWAIEERILGRWRPVRYVDSSKAPKSLRGQRIKEVRANSGRQAVSEKAKVRDVAKYTASAR
jgi:hypothetical protein